MDLGPGEELRFPNRPGTHLVADLLSEVGQNLEGQVKANYYLLGMLLVEGGGASSNCIRTTVLPLHSN